jgi:UDP-N-acetylglucosamine/UDP-N-acetylgalactosamine diphosphorylase
MSDLEARYRRQQKRLSGCGHEHLLRFWDELDDDRRQQLLVDLEGISIEQAVQLVPTHVLRRSSEHAPHNLKPVEFLPARPTGKLMRRYDEARELGVELLRTGKVAALTVAGGLGTRLGFVGPKGALPISPIRNKTLFQLFAEALLGTERRYGSCIRWYIMTSPGNHEVCKEFFTAHDHFGLDAEQIVFFAQGQMPAFDAAGRILLADKHRLALSPDGHGGTLRALADSGGLRDARAHGIELFSYFQVDNPLVRPIDPVFLGLHRAEQAQVSAKVVRKADDFEKMGVFCLVDGKVSVVEYVNLPRDLAVARDAAGQRLHDAGSPAIHAFSLDFIEQLTGRADGFTLPWHRADKKVACIDPGTGRRVTPDEPNAVKLETFIFDTFPMAERVVLLETLRSEEFSPVKNATGADSIDTARRDMIRRAANWLQRCGVAVPRRSDGEPDCTLEISPLLALDADHLCDQLDSPPMVECGACIYLG